MKTAAHHRSQPWRSLPWLVALAGVAISVSASLAALRVQRDDQRREFAHEVEEQTHPLEAALGADESVLWGIAGLFNASQEVTGQEFRTFVLPYFDASNRNRFYRTLGWAPRVPATGRNAYEEEVRSQGFLQFQITERTYARDGAIAMVPAGRREEYLPVGYVEPLVPNEMLLGYDLASTLRRRQALNRARDTGKVAATEPIILHDEAGRRRWTLVCVPIYRSKHTPATVDERRRDMMGFAFGVYRISDMIDAMVASHLRKGMSVAVFDGGTVSPHTRLYGQVHQGRPLRIAERIQVGGRDWLVVWQGAADFGGGLHGALAWAIMPAGISLTALLFIVLLLLQARAGHAQREAERDRLVLHTSMDGFFRAGFDGRLLDVNAAYCDMVGYARQELLAMRISDLEADESAEQVALHIRDIRRTGDDRFETRHRRKDGEVVDVEISTSVCRVSGHEFLVAFARDITERKAAEDAVRSSERRYRTLIENLPQKVFLKDRDSVYLSGNDNYARDLGIASEQLAGKVDYDFFPCELADKYRADDKRVMDSGETEELEEAYITDGREAWVHTVKTPVTDENGNVVAVLGIFWDITERHRAQREIETLKRQIEFILGATKTGLDIIDAEFNIRYIDTEWQKVYGDPTGRKCYQYFMDRDKPCPGCGVLQALETKAIAVTEEVLPKEGNRPIQVTTLPFQNDEGEWLVAEVNVDITERKRVERALERQNRRLEALNAVAAAAGSTLDIDGLAQRATDAVVTVTGALHGGLHLHSSEDDALVIRARSGMPHMVFPHDLDRLRVGDDGGGPAAAFRSGEIVVEDVRETVQRLEPGSPLRNALEILQHGQGLSQMLFVPLLAGGRAVGLMCLCYPEGHEVPTDDVKCLETARNAIGVAIDHAMLYQANQQRAQELARANEELAHANEELKSLDQMKNDFISLVGHELRTPLAGILGYAEFLLEEDLSREEAHEFAQTIHRESERLTRMVNAVLDLNKMEAGRIEYRKVVEDFNDIVRAAATSMEAAAGRRNQRLRLALASDSLTAEFDPDRIQQVVLNLLSNAVKFSPENSEIEIGTRSDDGSVVAWVRDQGVGIAPDDMPRIFEKFVQADHGSKRLEGTGLGLPICKGIVEGGHAGHMWAESAGPGQGAAFYFRIPRRAVDASADC